MINKVIRILLGTPSLEIIEKNVTIESFGDVNNTHNLTITFSQEVSRKLKIYFLIGYINIFEKFVFT